MTTGPLAAIAAEIRTAVRTAGRPIAVLAGSGVSDSAGVQTGEDLLREVARRRGEDPGPDPVAWYLRSVRNFPDYFGMVGDAGDALPDAIFEGHVPTPAQRSIAALAAAGVAGPILTPNLDRLLEVALRDAGLTFDVAYDLDGLARIDATRADLSGVVLLKLHGDHRDIGIRHTALGPHVYHYVIDALLDRLFATYDLLVCGWSASWDVPLRRALRRAEWGRVWWLQRGPVSAAARRIMEVRRPLVAEVASSDAGMTALRGLLLGTGPGAGCSRRPDRASDSGSAGRG